LIIESVHVKNFRSILDETLNCEKLTALVGANGSGKSSFLYAIGLFYSTSPTLEKEDYYGEDVSKEIIIAITFKNLDKEKETFCNYIQGEKLKVERVFTYNNSKIIAKYYGFGLRNPEFMEIRNLFAEKGQSKKAKEDYGSLLSKSKYVSLPPWTTIKNAQIELKKWEEENSDNCTRERDDGQFFGFNEVAEGYLGRHTTFLFIPAVKDASEEAAENRGSIITSLMDLVVRSVLAKKEAVKTFNDKTQEEYIEIMDPAKLPELHTLETPMSKTLETFVPEAKVNLDWIGLEQIVIPMPKVIVKLIEDGYKTDVSRTGHGLQRAFILTMLQHLALARTKVSRLENKEDAEQSAEEIQDKSKKDDNSLPNLVLAIEEPELYQHPNRQRHIAEILMQLARGNIPGVANKTQIIYCTHSPLFVGIDRIEQIRLLRKIDNGKDNDDNDNPKITKIFSTNLDEIAGSIWEAEGKPGTKYTGQTLLPRIQTIMTPWMNEGFFADVAILVEGEDDRAAILGIAIAKGLELEGNGFSVIPCTGKTNINRPYLIFHKLGIPVYIIWDGDYDGKGETKGICEKCGKHLDSKQNPKENHRLLALMSKGEEDWPEYIEENFACFKTNLETTLRTEIGIEAFDKYLQEYQSMFGITKRKHAIKNPNIISAIIKKAKDNGNNIETLDKIIDKALALKNHSK
jgi:putative ATP-dependent endonuclease of OLD family